MYKKFLFYFFLLLALQSGAQQNAKLVDSLKSELLKAKTSEDKVTLLGRLCRIQMNVNMKEADSFAKKMSEEAELSRNRKLMAKALMIHGERNSYLASNKDNLDKSIGYYNQALEMSRANKLDTIVSQALLALSSIYLMIPDADKALGYTTRALSVVSALKNDSMQALVHNSFGQVYQVKKERILSLRSYLNALRIGEEIKSHDLLRECYTYLSYFYVSIKEYDKAIDYAIRAMEEPSTKASATYNKVTQLNYIGSLYGLKKNYDMAILFYERSIRQADSLKFEQLKIPAYVSILNQYVAADQPQKALEYFNNNPLLRQAIMNFGVSYVIDHVYAIIYSGLARFDSAKYYFERAAPAFEKSPISVYKINFYSQYANFYKKSKNYPKAIEYYSKAKTFADQGNNLESQQDMAKELDTLYALVGNYQQSYEYSRLYHTYKDSLQKLGSEKDLLQMEVADEQERQKRLALEAEEKKRKRHSIQYMGITIGIAVVFVLLVILGVFQVSEGTIKILGFFAFIFLFEFIILLADNKIHSWTHGEPLPLLGIKILLIAMLLPLHHWLEKKVVHYLASKRLIIPSGKHIWNTLVKKTKT